MANAANRLTARKVQALSEPGRHADGGGLYLNVTASGAKSWIMLYRMAGKRHEMGLGPINAVPLNKARDLATEARSKIADGVNPLTERRATAEPEVAPPPPVTFADVALTYMADRETTWRNEAHRKQWRQTLEIQSASLWTMPVAAIGTDDVLAVLRPMWHAKAETARRIRGRIERILDVARVGGHRPADNPARWRGHLDVLLPRSGKLTRGHHAAMPYADVPVFCVSLEMKRGVSALALRMIILTAARSNEVRGMVWGEIDPVAALWTVPAKRMKGGRIHRVPLSPAALALLSDLRPADASPADLVFPSPRKRTKLSDMAFGMLLRKSGRPDITTHGFRSSFRDWVDEATDFSGDVAEAALAHLTGDETERAYRRGDALEKRRHLMDAWANFVCDDSGASSRMRSRSE